MMLCEYGLIRTYPWWLTEATKMGKTKKITVSQNTPENLPCHKNYHKYQLNFFISWNLPQKLIYSTAQTTLRWCMSLLPGVISIV